MVPDGIRLPTSIARITVEHIKKMVTGRFAPTKINKPIDTPISKLSRAMVLKMFLL